MKLHIELKYCKRPHIDRVWLENEFRDAVLAYCPSVEKLAQFKEDLHHEWYAALKRGWWALEEKGIPKTEIAGMQVEAKFIK